MGLTFGAPDFCVGSGHLPEIVNCVTCLAPNPKPETLSRK